MLARLFNTPTTLSADKPTQEQLKEQVDSPSKAIPIKEVPATVYDEEYFKNTSAKDIIAVLDLMELR